MTTRTLTGTYTSGYTLSPTYSALAVGQPAAVYGASGAYDGGDAGDAVTIPFVAPMTNKGLVAGGAGGAGSASDTRGGAGGGAGAAGSDGYTYEHGVSDGGEGRPRRGWRAIGWKRVYQQRHRGPHGRRRRAGGIGYTTGGAGGAGGGGVLLTAGDSASNLGAITGAAGGAGVAATTKRSSRRGVEKPLCVGRSPAVRLPTPRPSTRTASQLKEMRSAD